MLILNLNLNSTHALSLPSLRFETIYRYDSGAVYLKVSQYDLYDMNDIDKDN